MSFSYTDPEFHRNLGNFYTMWAALEATIEFEIGRQLGIPYLKTHAIVAGMEFGRKANLFRILIEQNNHKMKDDINLLLTQIQNEAKRNIFTHSIINSENDTITFIHRKVQNGKFSVCLTSFNEEKFIDHVNKINVIANSLGAILDIDQAEFNAFCAAAHNA